MHVRFSHCVGAPVVEDGTEEFLGSLSGILIHPDTGAIEGFFVKVSKFFGGEELFLSGLDIVRWGTRIAVSSSDVLSPVEDRIRLQTLLSDPRPILGQRIRTESGENLGRCRDVQFDTEAMRIEWLFPKRFVYSGVALPVSEIVEVREDGIIVRDPMPRVKEPVAEASPVAPLPSLDLTDAGPQPS